MRIIIWMVVMLTLLVACTSKEETTLMQRYQKNKPYHKYLQMTEKTQLYAKNNNDSSTKALLTATYLFEQNSDIDDIRDERFIIGVHIEEGSLKDEGYRLMLNGHLLKSMELLENDSPYLKDLSFVTEWGEYYMVTFPHVSSKSFRLVFESELYGKGVLHFAKVAKYVLSKKGF